MAADTSSRNSYLLAAVPGSDHTVSDARPGSRGDASTRLLFYIYSTNKYKRLIFPEMVRSIFMTVSDKNAE